MSTGLKANPDGSAAIQVGGTDVITLTSGGAATFVTSPTTVQAGTAAAPSITTSGDTNTGIFFPAADTIAFAEGGVESMRLNSAGNVGIGTSSPTQPLSIRNAGSAYLDVAGGNRTLGTNSFTVGQASDGVVAFFQRENSAMYWATNSTERARIDSSGNLFFAKSSSSVPTVGIEMITNGRLLVTSLDQDCLVLNRQSTDGTLAEFRHANVTEGSISISGTTVSYNGGHLARWSQLLNGQRDESILKGTVLSNLDEMCEWLDAEGNPLPNEQLNRMKVSDVEGDTNVAGVFVNWDNDDQDNPYDMNIAMTGDMIIRIAQGVTVQKGDLLMSAGDGTAKPQGDDIVRSKTVAKVTSNHVTCTYDDGSYCVPCVLMAC